MSCAGVGHHDPIYGLSCLRGRKSPFQCTEAATAVGAVGTGRPVARSDLDLASAERAVGAEVDVAAVAGWAGSAGREVAMEVPVVSKAREARVAAVEAMEARAEPVADSATAEGVKST